MPDITPNFSLPYPAPTDDPCLFAEQWCDFTDGINSIISNFQAGADRAIPVIPVAMLRRTTAVNVINGNLIPFTDVIIDTANMTDLDADPYRITVPRTGRYTVAAFMEKVSSGVVNSQITLFIRGELPANLDITTSTLDRGAAVTYFVPAYGPVITLQQGDRLSTFFTTGTATSQQVSAAWLSVTWHSDTEVP